MQEKKKEKRKNVKLISFTLAVLLLVNFEMHIFLFSNFQVTLKFGQEDNGSELRCEATNSAVSKPVSETITIELLPESTTAKQEYESKSSEADIVREQKEHKDYDGYDDEIYTYDYMNEIDSQPELQTNIFTGISKYYRLKSKFKKGGVRYLFGMPRFSSS